MIIGKSKKELEKMRAAGRLVGQVREELRRMVRPGMTTLELDGAAEKMIRDAGRSHLQGYHGFPYSICARSTSRSCTAFPRTTRSKRRHLLARLRRGRLKASSATRRDRSVGKVSAERMRLIEVAEKALSAPSSSAGPASIGRHRLGVQEYAEANGTQSCASTWATASAQDARRPAIPNYGKPGTKDKIRAGYVFAVER